MIIDDVVYIDNTVLKAVASCETSATARYVQGWTSPESTAPLRQGTAGHAALASYFKSLAQKVGIEERIGIAMAIYDMAYKDWADEHVPLDDRLSYQNTYDILQEYLYVIAEKRFPFRIKSPKHAEIPFSYPLDDTGKYIFYGRMDLLGTHIDDRGWWVVDHKFTGRIDQGWARQWKADSQITGYLWAALQHNPETKGAYINVIETSKLPSSDRKCREHGLPYSECKLAHIKHELLGPITRTPEQMEEWKRTALGLAEKYEELYHLAPNDPKAIQKYLRREGPFTNACRWCEFYDWCFVGDRNPRLLKQMFKIDHWRPYNPLDYQQQEVG